MKEEEQKRVKEGKEEGKTPEQAVTIASSVTELKGSSSTLEEDNSASHLEEIEPADAGIHEGQTGIIDHGSSDKLDTTRLRTNPLETEWTKVVQLVGSRAREEGVREGVTTEIDQSEVRVLEDQVGYISDSESGQSVSGLRSVYQCLPSLASPGEHHILYMYIVSRWNKSAMKWVWSVQWHSQDTTDARAQHGHTTYVCTNFCTKCSSI